MLPRAEFPFLVSGEHEDDMGMLKGILNEYGPEGSDGSTFVDRWSPTDIEFTPDRFGALVILGDKYYRATSSKYDRERRWLTTALDGKRPVLAICFGAQLLAALKHGGRKPCGLDDLGTCHNGVFEVALSCAAKSDPVLRPLLTRPLATMSHSDYFLEPKGTTALAWSACDRITPHCEAFRVGEPDEAVYGLQFHPEPTVEMLQDERKKYRWFEVIPPREMLETAQATGEQLIRAWAELAVAR